MNIHPLFVHFPVALLTLYAVLECIRFKKLNDLPAWPYLKISLLVLGTVGALAALLTGDMARQFHRDVRQLVSMHELFGQMTTIIFGILAVNYIILIAERFGLKGFLPPWLQKLWALLVTVRNALFGTPLVILLALLGLVSLVITGALGGIIVYGPSTDPVTLFVNKVLSPYYNR